MTRWSWTHWLLLASLVINGLLGGYLIGRQAGPPHWRMPPMAGEPATLTFGTVPPPLREAMRAELRERRSEVRPRFETLRNARGELRDAIGAEPFDPKRLEAAFAALRNAQGTLQVELHAVAVEVVGKMSAEERRRLAEWRPEGRDRDRRDR